VRLYQRVQQRAIGRVTRVTRSGVGGRQWRAHPGLPPGCGQGRLRAPARAPARRSGLRLAHDATDSQIMASPRANDYVVPTHDLDFSAIFAATHGEKPSVVQIRADDVSPEVIGKQVVVALRQMASDLEDGALLTVDPSRTRLRVLPLQPNG
jgi:predicted nuclease of predicted toxin-antitoxin system